MDTLEDHLSVLGLRGIPSRAELTHAYRRAMQQWHPDKHQGGEARKRQAEYLSKRINAAYAHLREHAVVSTRRLSRRRPRGRPRPA
jgi:DnaJ-class molecular chaperone